MDVRNRLIEDDSGIKSPGNDSFTPPIADNVDPNEAHCTVTKTNGSDSTSNENSNSDVRHIGVNFWVLTFILFILGFFAAVGFQTSCSLSLPSASISPDVDARFKEVNVRAYLRKATSDGHRFVGSVNNEEKMPAYILSLLRGHMAIDSAHLITDMDEQIAHFGGFELSMFGRGSFVGTYENIRNIVFRIKDSTSRNASSPSAVLINCHYDTVIDSPGASDDFVSCATMLEVIRVTLTGRPHLKHDLIFLFNGAEETMLLGSHAFVSQHSWMKDVRMVVNLEAAGAGGRQIVFQSGPKQPWIIQEYAAIAKQPFASILAQEVFQSGIIPSDTDFRIFRDFGHVPGIDIAYFANGYVYHTSFDREERIPPSCIQNSGDNLLAFVLRLGNSPYVADTNKYEGTNNVFFDFVGLFVVQYSFSCSYFINILSVMFVVLRCMYCIYLDVNYSKYLGAAFLNQTICLVGVLIILLIQGYVMYYVGNGMSWFCIRYNIVGVYIFPLLWFFFFYHSYVARKTSLWPNSHVADEAHFQAAQIWISFPLLFLTLYDFGSSHFFTVVLIFPFFGRILINYINHNIFASVPGLFLDIWKQILLFSIPFVYMMYQFYSFFDLFIPIMGRSGTSIIPDIFIAVMVFLCSIIPILYFAGKVYQTNTASLSSIRFLLLHSTLSFLILVHFTNFGFPYNTSYEAPRKQRLMVLHVNRVFRDQLSTTQSYDSGLWLVPLDHNLAQHLEGYVPELQVTKASQCAQEPYCGFPFLRPLAHALTHSFYLSRNPHKLSPSLELFVIDKVGLDRSTFNLTFTASGPSHTHIYFMVEPGVQLTSWSFTSGQPKPALTPRKTDEKHYFVGYSYGYPPKQPLTFWVMFTAEANLPFSKARIHVALSGHYTHGHEYRTRELRAFIEHLPDWVVPTYWTATYERWTILLRKGARYIK